MVAKEHLFRITCRPALPKDTPEVLELTRTIWEGEDYLPHVWNDWLADPGGLLAVAEFGGKVVGTGKLTSISARQWWLEGLRVHPGFEGRGIASRMHDYLMEVWDRTDGEVIRMATASFRAPVHHLAGRSGFRKVGEVTPFIAQRVEEPGNFLFQLAVPDELDEIMRFMQANEIAGGPDGLIDLGWQWAKVEPELLAALLGQESVWWWSGREGILAAKEDLERETRTALLQLAACAPGELWQLLLDFQRLAASLGYHQAGWLAPLQTDFIPRLEQAGFTRDWEASIYIFEKTRGVTG